MSGHPALPSDFLWGAGTSAHQVEGGNHNDWSVWELANADRLATIGAEHYQRHSPIWAEIAVAAADPANYVSGRAVEHYQRYASDFDLAQTLGHNAHRLSLEWSRIEPQKGQYSAEALEHYRQVILALRERGLQPLVTLWHFTLPVWLAEEGGWLAPSSATYFANYTREVMRVLGSDVEYWLTLNEPVEYAQAAYRAGMWPPEHRSLVEYWRVKRHLRQAHTRASRVIRELAPTARIGLAHSAIYMDARGRGLWSHLLKWCADWDRNSSFLRPLVADLDYIGINFYMRSRIGWWYGEDTAGQRSDMGWELYPEALELVLVEHARYARPLIVTENGLADQHDTYREAATRYALDAIVRAIARGVPVLGYLHWSLLDNFELNRGFWPRFGLIAVDRQTFKRSIRPSAVRLTDYVRSLQGTHSASRNQAKQGTIDNDKDHTHAIRP